jgi:DNA-directed RNA polymerase delta subunit
MKDEKDNKSGILDKIIGSKQYSSLKNFEPTSIAAKALSMLKERDRVILAKRFGLLGFSTNTLEAIGKEHDLTRERVRQIEKDALKFLRAKMDDEQLNSAVKVLTTIISECGKVIREIELVKSLTDSPSEEEKRSILFLLHIAEELLEVKENEATHAAWASVTYNHEFFENIINSAKGILKASGKPMLSEDFINKIKQTEAFNGSQIQDAEKVLKNYLELSKEIEKNPFGEYGLAEWPEIKPKDVGDKAYIVLKHNAKPEHYAVITELINKHGFDKKVAHKETVHNELIKDSRFVLVGRGIYALTEWGYQKGIVSDVIRDILKQGGPEGMSKDKIVDMVMEHRLVKRNTVLVALSNKKLFTKVAKNRYGLAVHN